MMVWPEIDQVVKNHRYELILSGEKFDKYLEENVEIDENLWSIKQLNFLELSNSNRFEILSRKIGNLIHLSTLTLTSNCLKSLPEDLSLLISLRHFNVSNNQIENIPQDIFMNLSQLETLNLSQNRLKILPKFSKEIHRKLSTMNLSHNFLVEFPFEFENLSHLDLSTNQFEDFPLTILQCSNLKVLHFEENLLKEIPSDLSTLHKLKEIYFKSNPLKDNRLKKLIDQDKIKATIEYLEKQMKKCSISSPPTTTTTTTTTSKNSSNNRNDSIDEENQRENLIRILHFDHQIESKSKQITILPSTTNIRRYFLSAVFLNLNLETEGNLKKFLTLQNELHDGICEKRTLASIGTHDWNLIKGNLVYDAKDPNQIAFIPLGKPNKIISAKEFYEQLSREAEQQRKLKKRNQISGLYKYLSLMENQSEFVFLSDEDRQILSIPPLTNSERTKLNPKSRTIFVEITSNHSMDICYRIMENFIEEIFRQDLVEKDPQGKFDQILFVQQTRTIDQNGKLKVTYPSRTDLQFPSSKNIHIERLFPSD